MYASIRNVTCRNVKNRTEFYLLRSSRIRAVSSLRYVNILTYNLAKFKNILRCVKFSRMFLQIVKCLRYGTLRYVT